MAMNRKVLIGLIILSFLLVVLASPIITTNSQTPPSASAYVASISVSSNPFILNTTLPAINQLGSNIRFFQYPNLTGQLYAYEQQLPQTTPVVDTVESTSWKVFPYWQNGELVINSSNAGQYIAWRYSPVSNVINITIHVTSYPDIADHPGIVVYSPTVGDQSSDNNIANFQAVLVTFVGLIFYHSPTSGWEQLYSSLPQPNPNYPFTFTAILTENSAGNVTVSTVYINSTAYTVNVNTPLPWSQIGYAGIRADPGNLFYVSYFGVSPAPYGGVEQFVNNVESTSWKVLPYWENGELVINSTGTSAYGLYIAWRYSPISNTINATISVTSYPSKSAYASIAFYSANPQNPHAFMVAFYTGAVYYFGNNGATELATFPTPNPRSQ